MTLLLPSTFSIYYARFLFSVISHILQVQQWRLLRSHFRLFLILSILSLSTSLNLHRPSLTADEIHDLLPRYGFSKGLLPNNVKSYTISDDGDFTVDFMSTCYVNFPGQTVFYDKKIFGKLSYGSVKNVQGIRAKEAFLWLPITAMESNPSSATIVFSVGFVSKTLPASMFKNIPSCARHLNLQKSLESA